ncbi:outer membrane protein assembly factor BamB family protein, partial [Metapseudomonas otitidis]
MHTPHARNALLPRILGVALLAMAIALVVGGGQLIGLGGSWYYLLAGLGVGASALLLLTHRGQALLVFAAVLAGSTVWAWWEVRLDWWQLVPRLALWFVVGLVLWLPWVRNSLSDAGRLPANALLVALVLAGGTALAAQFTEPHRFPGMIDRAAPASAPATPPAQPAGDWQAYGRSNAGDRYSPLDQITPENVDQLELAWSYRTGDLPDPDDPQETTAENTPLKANGLLYVCTPHSQVIALDPDSGREIWRFDPKISTQDADSFKGWAHMTCRGVAYHQQDTPGSGQRCERRLFLPTADTRLMALDADDGKPCEAFGDKGSIDLTRGIGSFTPGGYYSTSPPGVSRDLVIIGGHVTDNVSEDEPSGVIRAYDVRDGHLVWNWDPGNPDDTAPLAEGRTYTRNSPNMWSVMSLDEELGLLYLPMGNQTPDQWGGRRTPASETYSAGVTALEIATGKVRWTFQMTHHDLWDMDVGGQPTLVDLPGQKPGDAPRPALIASTKQGSLYVLDRRTGQPIVPVKETPVPQGAAKG